MAEFSNNRKLGNKATQTVSVKDFGAVGDGSTDDRDAVNDAIQSLSASGGTVFIPNSPQGYRMGGSLIEVPSNISIVGFNTKLLLEKASSFGNTYACFRYNGKSNGSISGIRFEAYDTLTRNLNGDTDFDQAVTEGQASASEVTTFRIGVQISNSSIIKVSDCKFGASIHNGIKVDTATNNNIILNDLQFDQVASQCTFVSNANGVVLSNVISRDCCQSRFDHVLYARQNVFDLVVDGISVKGSNGSSLDFFASGGDLDTCSVSNITIRNSRSGLIFSGDSGGSVKNLTATGISINNSEKEAVFIAGGEPCENISISGINIFNTQDRAFVVTGSAHSNIRFSDFLINGSDNDYSMYFEYAEDLTVENGSFIDCRADSGAGVIESTLNNGSVSGVTDAGGGDVRVAATSHGMSDGDIVTISGTTDYNGTFTVTNVDSPNSFDVTDTYVSSQSGNWVEDNDPDNLILRNCQFIWHAVTPNTSPIQMGVGTGEIDNCQFRADSSISKYCIENTSTGFRVGNCRESNFLGVTHPADNSIVLVNEGPKEAALADGDTTPSVLNLTSLITANTGATTISDFDDGVEGQVIWVEVNDANTTFDFTGSSLKGNNGADYAAASGDMIQATLRGNNWHCFISQG